jgi:hypothetical protein
MVSQGAYCPLARLCLPGAELALAQASGGQGGVASRRTVPQGWLHCYQPELSTQRHNPLLQRQRHGGAMDKRGQIRAELDQAFLPQVRGQPDEVVVVRSGLQLGQLHEKAGAAGVSEPLVANQYSD